MFIWWAEQSCILYQTQEFCSSMCNACSTPLDSETGLTGELWSNRLISLNSKFRSIFTQYIYFHLDFKKIYIHFKDFFEILRFFIFWNFFSLNFYRFICIFLVFQCFFLHIIIFSKYIQVNIYL